jgi:hypothetical protein
MANLPFIQALLGTLQQKQSDLPEDRTAYLASLDELSKLPSDVGASYPFRYNPTEPTPPNAANNGAPPISTGTGVSAPAIPPEALIAQSPRAQLGRQISDIQLKDYSPGVYRNPVTGETTNKRNKEGFSEVVREPGRDRDKKWSFAEKLGGALLGWASGGLAGGVKGATDRNFFEKLGDQQKLQRLAPAYERQQSIDKYDTEEAYRKAQTATIPIDDELRRLQIENTRESSRERIRAQARQTIFKGKHFDPKNPTHRKQAAEAGLDPDALSGWDDRNPLEKQVAGVTYRLNRQTGAYEPTNLPKDESKTVTDYTVEMPNGEKRTYKVAQKDAANFSTQMSSLGARLAQQESQFSRRMALDTNKFDFAKKQFEQMQDLRERALKSLDDARKSGDQSRVQRAEQDAKDYDVRVEQLRLAARKALANGELTQEQFDAMVGVLP